ncbi:DinB family protein [Ferrimicrobium sp.]|uniref:DinB family protein n=1 Tax=Ferrimicrobium sp. TaxID=2926050 RepID=UPI0026331FCE|nr:DinB family protein [Ferrimicrobium sp.]
MGTKVDPGIESDGCDGRLEVFEEWGLTMLTVPLEERFNSAFLHFCAAMDGAPGGAVTEPDAETGEQWDNLHVLGHVSEMLEYWLAEVLRVLTHGPDEPFGRLKRSPERIARIERSSELAVDELRHEIHLRALATIDLCRLLTPEQLSIRGLHPKFGLMTVERILMEFGVEHLHEHALQLESL